MTGSSGRFGLLLLPHESIVGAIETGNAGFVDGVADVEAEVVPLAREGGDCDAWLLMNAVTWGEPCSESRVRRLEFGTRGRDARDGMLGR